jgi:hypothetical protein
MAGRVCEVPQPGQQSAGVQQAVGDLGELAVVGESFARLDVGEVAAVREPTGGAVSVGKSSE